MQRAHVATWLPLALRYSTVVKGRISLEQLGHRICVLLEFIPRLSRMGPGPPVLLYMMVGGAISPPCDLVDTVKTFTAQR